MFEDRANEIITEFLPLIFSVALKVVRDRDQAEDVAQEACLKIYNGLAKFKGDSSLKTWIYRITVNAGLDHLRKLRQLKENPNIAFEDKEVDWEDSSPSLYDFIEEEDLKQLVREKVLELPLEYRLPLLLRDAEELTYEEISQVLNLPLGTVKSRIHRSRIVLRNLLLADLGTKTIMGASK